MPTVASLKFVIYKQRRELQLFEDARLESVHTVALGRNESDKEVEGDEATPLGDFYVCAKNPRSRFHRSLCLSYPNAAHAARGLRDGLIDTAEHAKILAALREKKMPPQHTRLGGEIYIHGSDPDIHVKSTRGCIALDNEIMEFLFERTQLGTPVSIKP